MQEGKLYLVKKWERLLYWRRELLGDNENGLSFAVPVAILVVFRVLQFRLYHLEGPFLKAFRQHMAVSVVGLFGFEDSGDVELDNGCFDGQRIGSNDRLGAVFFVMPKGKTVPAWNCGRVKVATDLRLL